MAGEDSQHVRTADGHTLRNHAKHNITHLCVARHQTAADVSDAQANCAEATTANSWGALRSRTHTHTQNTDKTEGRLAAADRARSRESRRPPHLGCGKGSLEEVGRESRVDGCNRIFRKLKGVFPRIAFGRLFAVPVRLCRSRLGTPRHIRPSSARSALNLPFAGGEAEPRSLALATKNDHTPSQPQAPLFDPRSIRTETRRPERHV